MEHGTRCRGVTGERCDVRLGRPEEGIAELSRPSPTEGEEAENKEYKKELEQQREKR